MELRKPWFKKRRKLPLLSIKGKLDSNQESQASWAVSLLDTESDDEETCDSTAGLTSVVFLMPEK